MKYAKTLKENLQLLKEDTVVVIHTKNGKVDYIEKGSTILGPKGTTLVFDKGVDFKDFVGMDPKAAKDSLVKYSRFNPNDIIIEGCGKVEEGFDVKDGGNGKVYYTAETQSDAEAWAKANVNVLHRPLRVTSGYTMYKKFEPRTIVKESIRTAPKIDMSSQEAWDKSNAEIEKWKKELDSKADDMQKKMARMAGRCYYDMTVKMNPSEAEKCFNEFEKIYNDLDSLLSKYKIAKN